MNPENRAHRLLRYVGRGLTAVGVIGASIFPGVPANAEASTGRYDGGRVNCSTTVYPDSWAMVGQTQFGSYRGSFGTSVAHFGGGPGVAYAYTEYNIAAVQECNMPEANRQIPVTTVYLRGYPDNGTEQGFYQYPGNPPPWEPSWDRIP